jgi:hypothetical protein
MPKMAMMPLHRPSAGGARVRIHLRERMGYIAAGKGGNSSFFAGFLSRLSAKVAPLVRDEFRGGVAAASGTPALEGGDRVE